MSFLTVPLLARRTRRLNCSMYTSNYELFGSDGSDDEEAAAPAKAASPIASAAALEVKVEGIIATRAATAIPSSNDEDNELSNLDKSDDESLSRCVLCCLARLA